MPVKGCKLRLLCRVFVVIITINQILIDSSIIQGDLGISIVSDPNSLEDSATIVIQVQASHLGIIAPDVIPGPLGNWFGSGCVPVIKTTFEVVSKLSKIEERMGNEVNKGLLTQPESHQSSRQSESSLD
jgi:hypothetical protein